MIGRYFDARRQRDLPSQGQGHLAQLIVKQGGGFVEHPVIRDEGGRERDQGNQNDERDREAGSNGIHDHLGMK
jgi:hypothetical protein